MIPGAIDCGTCTGELIIEGVSLHAHNWCVLDDLTPLWLPVKFRGSNLVVPGSAGTLPYARRIDEASFSLRFVVSGIVDAGGAEVVDPKRQLTDTIELLASTAFDVSDTTKGAQIIRPDGTSVTASVQPTLTPGRSLGGVIQVFTLALIVPAGRFA